MTNKHQKESYDNIKVIGGSIKHVSSKAGSNSMVGNQEVIFQTQGLQGKKLSKLQGKIEMGEFDIMDQI